MVRSVTAEGIRIGDALYSHPIGLAAGKIIDRSQGAAIGDLTESDLAELLEAETEVVVIGTGRSNTFAPRELVFAMARRQIGLEVMDTAAAARTYNVLASEGRRVAAVFYL